MNNVLRFSLDNDRMGVGPAPERLDEDERRAWDDIVRACGAGVVLRCDALFLELTSIALAGYREAKQPKKPAVKSMLRKFFIDGATAEKLMERNL
jgi:hypothetical protein